MFFLRHSKVNLRIFTYAFINLRLQQKLNLQLLGLFHKTLRSTAGKFPHSVVCSNTYAPRPNYVMCRYKVGLMLMFTAAYDGLMKPTVVASRRFKICGCSKQKQFLLGMTLIEITVKCSFSACISYYYFPSQVFFEIVTWILPKKLMVRFFYKWLNILLSLMRKYLRAWSEKLT